MHPVNLPAPDTLYNQFTLGYTPFTASKIAQQGPWSEQDTGNGFGFGLNYNRIEPGHYDSSSKFWGVSLLIGSGNKYYEDCAIAGTAGFDRNGLCTSGDLAPPLIIGLNGEVGLGEVLNPAHEVGIFWYLQSGVKSYINTDETGNTPAFADFTAHTGFGTRIEFYINAHDYSYYRTGTPDPTDSTGTKLIEGESIEVDTPLNRGFVFGAELGTAIVIDPNKVVFGTLFGQETAARFFCGYRF